MKYRLAWLALGLSALTAFAVIETLALSHDDGVSLSQLTVDLLYAWPPLGYLLAWLSGVLTCHFTWWWVPKQKLATCGECRRTILLEKGNHHAQ